MDDPKDLLDPVCGMAVDIDEARERGLTLRLGDREYAACSERCLRTFATSPRRFVPKVDAWLAARTAGERPAAQPTAAEPADAGKALAAGH